MLAVMVDWIGSVTWWIGLDWILKDGPTDISGLASAVSSPSRVWGGAPAEIEFGAL